jgi:flavin-binding protein dodecin
VTAPQLASQPPPSRLQTDAQLALLLLTYQHATQALRDRLSSFVTTLWRSLGYYGQAEMRQFTGSVVPVVAGAQQQMASLTAAMLAQQQSLTLGTPFLPPALDPARVSGAGVRNGADPAEVYGRPFHLVWRQLDELPKQPGSIDQAIQAGLDRANQTALTDLQLAKTHSAQQTLAKDKHVVGYRRVLEGPYSCGLCIVASTIRYHKRDLMPLHPACDCAVEGLYGSDHVGKYVEPVTRGPDGELQVIGDLGDVHSAIADRFGKSDSGARVIPGAKNDKGQPLQYRDALIVHRHGELGPVLAVRGQPFQGPSDLTH